MITVQADAMESAAQLSEQPKFAYEVLTELADWHRDLMTGGLDDEQRAAFLTEFAPSTDALKEPDQMASAKDVLVLLAEMSAAIRKAVQYVEQGHRHAS